ncbi:hypothetical protein HON52_02010 [Candidatus Uhrbacteria bacterium]|jgi:hypothetical protein|nr:hypothetical protein [Candidatus Uhrbacteria bacterium]
MPILEAIELYFNTTPPEEMGAYFLLIIAPFLFFAVLVWGFTQVWIDRKQGQYWAKLEWDLLAVNVPADSVQTPKGMENFFTNLAGSKSSITMKEKWLWGKFQSYFSFEIVSNGGKVGFYIRTIKKYRDLVEAALYAQYPEAQILEVEDYVGNLPDDYPHDDYNIFGSELSMSKNNIFPLKTYDTFEHQGEKDMKFKDPMLPMFEILGKMRPGEFFWIQMVIMSPDSQDWRKEGAKYIKKMYGVEEKKKKGWFDTNVGWLPRGILEQAAGMVVGGEAEKAADDFKMFKITPDERELLEAVMVKTSQIGWYTKIRIVYGAKHELFRKGTSASMMKGIFNQLDAGWNKLSLTASSTPKDDYPWQEWSMTKRQKALKKKYNNRSLGMGANPFILSASELATIWHFPAADARTPVLTSLGARMAEAPVELTFAGDDEEILPNFAPSGDSKSPFAPATAIPSAEEAFSQPVEIVVPTPTSPTQSAAPAVRQVPIADQVPQIEPAAQPSDAPVFSANMPAPLPPGLDLNDEPIDSQDAPSNIPT